jgi:hypothetical protein
VKHKFQASGFKATEMAEKTPDSRPNPIHPGDDRSAPYPVSRLAPSFGLVKLAEEVEKADQMISGRANAQLAQIAAQIRSLQAQAREVMQNAHDDMQLHHAKCRFKKIPGKVYHLYRQPDGELHFSMLSPDDWNGRPPQEFVGSYRLQNDMSWGPADQAPNTVDPELLELLALQKP